MAELSIAVRPSTFDDGDIVSAWTDRDVAWHHCHTLCFPRGEGGRLGRRNAHGLIPADDPARDYYQAIHEYRFARVSQTEVLITRLADNAQITVRDGIDYEHFDGQTYRMHVREKLALYYRTLTSPGGNGLPVFGAPGHEIWYGGREDRSAANLDVAWTAIEKKLEVDRTDAAFQLAPLPAELPPQTVTLTVPDRYRTGSKEPLLVKYFGADRQYHTALEGTEVVAILGGAEGRELLRIKVADFTDEQKATMLAPEVEIDSRTGEEVKHQERTHAVEWRESLSLTGRQIDDVLDASKWVDLRSETPVYEREMVVEEKPPLRTETPIGEGVR